MAEKITLFICRIRRNSETKKDEAAVREFKAERTAKMIRSDEWREVFGKQRRKDFPFLYVSQMPIEAMTHNMIGRTAEEAVRLFLNDCDRRVSQAHERLQRAKITHQLVKNLHREVKTNPDSISGGDLS